MKLSEFQLLWPNQYIEFRWVYPILAKAHAKLLNHHPHTHTHTQLITHTPHSPFFDRKPLTILSLPPKLHTHACLQAKSPFTLTPAVGTKQIDDAF